MFKADPRATRRSSETSAPWRSPRASSTMANPENWLISDGKLYIFGKRAPIGPALFQKDLAGNIAKANQNRPLLSEAVSSRAVRLRRQP